jgi:4-hydroxythreonine-4-phosphate dehydrogenase
VNRPVGITCGDVSGIGPELIQHLWQHRQRLHLPDFIVIGPRGVFPMVPDAALIDIPQTTDIAPGTPSDHSATVALKAMQSAALLAASGDISAIVTAPVHKASLYDIGFTAPGQTEFFAAACHVAPEATVMMLVGPALRTVPLTIHIPLRDVFTRLTSELIVRQATIAFHSLRHDFGIAAPRLALAGINPHAGESGHIGDEERTIMQPAINLLREAGIELSGPHPADTLFAASHRPRFDAVLCAYHDQALIPVKTLDLDHTVNVTLGLPVVRTSPDHGTAHDIAGQGMAKPDSMIAALRLAAQMVKHRQRTNG